MFFAYDTPDDREPLEWAGRRLMAAGFKKEHHGLRAFVLIGFPHDRMDAAARRLHDTWEMGFFPMAMLWRDKSGMYLPEWRSFQRRWARPHLIQAELTNGC